MYPCPSSEHREGVRGTGRSGRLPTGSPYKQCVCLYVRNIKKCMGILKSPNIVNLHREMTMLKLKINVNLPQLLCIVISVAENGEFERIGGFCVDSVTTRYKKETRVESSLSTAPAPSRFSHRN